MIGRVQMAEAIVAELKHNPEQSAAQLWRTLGLPWCFYLVLRDLENDGRIVGRWVHGSYPRRRLYRTQGAERA